METIPHEPLNRNRPPKEHPASMTRRERDDLAALVRCREKVAIADVKERSAALNAEIEARLSAEFSAEDALWAEVTRAAQVEITKADAEIARRCEAIGVPAAFRPRLELSWRGRGVNADPSRRAELRQLARAHNAHQEKAGVAAIVRQSVEIQTSLLASGLTTDGERTSSADRFARLAYGHWEPPELPDGEAHS